MLRLAVRRIHFPLRCFRQKARPDPSFLDPSFLLLHRIFVTTSAFSQPAVDTARGLGSRIVLIDGLQLSRLMIRYNVGCRDEDVLHLKKVDEDFFED